MKTDRNARKNLTDLGKSVANLPPERHGTFLKVYENDQHFMLGYHAELRHIKENCSE